MPVEVDNAGKREQVPDDEFHEGPPGEGDPNFGNKTQAEKILRWQEWFKMGGTLSTIKAARSVERAIAQAAQPAAGPNAIQMGQYGAAPGLAENFAVPITNAYAGANHRGPLIEQVPVSPDQFKVGPRDANGDFDPNFDLDANGQPRTRAQMRADWQEAMSPNTAATPGGREYRPVRDGHLARHKKLLRETRARLADKPYPHLDTLLQKTSVWGARNPKSAVTVGLLIGAGLGTSLYYLIKFLHDKVNATPPPVPPNAPTDVEISGTTSQQANTVTIGWKYVENDAAKASHFSVSLISDSDALIIEPTLDATSRGYEFQGVANGTWTASVSAVGANEAVSAAASSIPLVLPVAKTLPATTSPNKPTGISVEEIFLPEAGTRVLKVTWDAPTGTVVPNSYKVGVSANAAPYIYADTTLREFIVGKDASTALEPGSYRVVVEAFTDGNGSGETDAVTIDFVGKASQAPGAPTGVTTENFVVEGDSQSSVTVMWDSPPAMDEVTQHVVIITPPAGGAAIPAQMTNDDMVTFDALPDGMYTIEVQALNSFGVGPTTTVFVTLMAARDKTNIDWSSVVSQELQDQWNNMGQQLSAMDEDTEFWPQLMPLLRQPGGSNSTPASFEEQAILVKLLTSWITSPDKPVDRRLTTRANSLRQLTNPVFPATPPDAGAAGYAGDPLALWIEAQNLIVPQTGARVALRTRLFAIEKALHDYLGYEEPPMNV